MLNNILYKNYYEDIKFKYLSGEVNVLPSPTICELSRDKLRKILDDVIYNLTDEEKAIYDDIRVSMELKKLRTLQLSLTRNIKYHEEILVSDRKQLEEVKEQLELLTLIFKLNTV